MKWKKEAILTTSVKEQKSNDKPICKFGKAYVYKVLLQ